MRHFAFLRNVMIGRKGLTQTVLLDAYRQAGAADPVSHLATGNVAFTLPDAADRDALARQVSETLRDAIGLEEPIFYRSLDDLRRMAALDPYAAAPTDDVRERDVTFLPSAFAPLPPLPFVSKRRDVEIVASVGSEVYSVMRVINGRPGPVNAVVERLTKVRASTRNWNTVQRLLERYA